MNLRKSLITMMVLFIPLPFLFFPLKFITSFLPFPIWLWQGTHVSLTPDGVRHEEVGVWATSHPGLVLWAAGALLLFLWLMREKAETGLLQVVSLKRRFCAFLIDLLFVIFVLIPLVPLAPLALEASQTGRFVWHFNRNYKVPSDALMLPLLAVVVLLVLLYFLLSLARSRPTVGAYLLGITTTLDGNPPVIPLRRVFQRVFLEFSGLCLFPYTLLIGLDDQGQTWYDRLSGLRIHRLGKPEASEAAAGAGPVPAAREFPLVWYFMFIFLACGMAYWYGLAFPSGQAISSRNIAPEWKIYRYSDFNMSLESPFPLRKKDVKSEPGVDRKLILSADIPELGLLIEARGLVYVQNLPPDALQQFSEFIPGLFKSNPTVKDFKCENRAGTCSGLPAVYLEGTYSSEGSLCRLEAVGVVRGAKAWMVEIAFIDGPDMKKTADRVVKSLAIEGLGTMDSVQ